MFHTRAVRSCEMEMRVLLSEPKTMPVTVPADGEVKLEITLSLDDLPKIKPQP